MNIEQRIAQALPHDKCLHFIAGVLIFAAFHFQLGTYAMYVVLGLGSAKEVYDASRNGDASKGDIFATVAGGIAGYICGL